MSIKYQPATDEQISDMPARWVAPREFGGGIDLDDGFSLLSRIEADREKIDGLKGYIESYKDGMKAIREADREEIARLCDPMHPFGRCLCGGEGRCRWCKETEMREEIARLKAERDAELSKLRQAVGLLSTLHPTMVMDPDDPITMAHAIHAHVEKEIARLKAERDEDRRREYGYSQQVVDALTKERDALKAEVERLKPNQQLYPCANCGKLRTKAEGGAVFTLCDSCWNGTGRAR